MLIRCWFFSSSSFICYLLFITFLCAKKRFNENENGLVRAAEWQLCVGVCVCVCTVKSPRKSFGYRICSHIVRTEKLEPYSKSCLSSLKADCVHINFVLLFSFSLLNFDSNSFGTNIFPADM